MLVAPEVRKVGWRHLGRGEIKSCTRLWRKKSKMLKPPGSRNTFGSWDVEKVHAWGQNVRNTAGAEHFWQLSRAVQKADAILARNTCRSQNLECTSAPEHFWKEHFLRSGCGLAWQAPMDSAPSQKWARCVGLIGFAAASKTMAGVGRLKRMCQDACTVTGAALRMTWLHFFVAGAIL